MPVVRTLAINHTFNPSVYDGRFQNQFYFGPSLMVCPVESTKEITKVLFPDSHGWYSLYDDSFTQGGTDERVDCPLEKLPVYVKAGSVLTLQSLVNHTGEKPSDTLFVHVYHGKKSVPFTYYEDDGESYQYESGSFFKRTIELDASKRQVNFGKVEGTYTSQFKKVKIFFHGFADVKAAGAKSESFRFVDPLPNFDPTGSVAPAPSCAVKTMVVDASKDLFHVKY